MAVAAAAATRASSRFAVEAGEVVARGAADAGAGVTREDRLSSSGSAWTATTGNSTARSPVAIEHLPASRPEMDSGPAGTTSEPSAVCASRSVERSGASLAETSSLGAGEGSRLCSAGAASTAGRAESAFEAAEGAGPAPSRAAGAVGVDAGKGVLAEAVVAVTGVARPPTPLAVKRSPPAPPPKGLGAGVAGPELAVIHAFCLPPTNACTVEFELATSFSVNGASECEDLPGGRWRGLLEPSGAAALTGDVASPFIDMAVPVERQRTHEVRSRANAGANQGELAPLCLHATKGISA